MTHILYQGTYSIETYLEGKDTYYSRKTNLLMKKKRPGSCGPLSCRATCCCLSAAVWCKTENIFYIREHTLSCRATCCCLSAAVWCKTRGRRRRGKEGGDGGVGEGKGRGGGGEGGGNFRQMSKKTNGTSEEVKET
jgi:hypothetical protein